MHYGYVPIDVLLKKPPIRLLRAIRRFDWIDTKDVFDLLGVPCDGADTPQRNIYLKALSRLFLDGLVVGRPIGGRTQNGGPYVNCREYRISKDGMEWLARQIELSNVPPTTDEEEAAEANGELGSDDAAIERKCAHSIRVTSGRTSAQRRAENQDRRLHRISLGVCTECSEPALRGYRMCARHKQERCDYMKSRRNEAIAHGICGSCRKGEIAKDRSKALCGGCLSKSAERSQRSKQNA